jgi:hypothetical protein
MFLPTILIPAIATVAIALFLLSWSSGYRAGEVSMEEECHHKYDALRKAGLSLYMSGPWHTSSHQLPLFEQRLLWIRLREALKLDPGTATTLKVAHEDMVGAAPESPVEEAEESPATPLAEAGREGGEEAYSGFQGHCPCGLRAGHEGPHASPVI